MLAFREEQAQGLVEYALILILVAVVVVLIIGVFGGQIANYFSRVTDSIGNIP
ncbi:MAG: pilus assembly protein [Chloroflexi bacterium]|nr:pilus assembly protein [Chloroflexota bacterium]